MPPSEENDPRGSFITREEASNIALAAAKEGARQAMAEIFTVLGVNISNFESMKDFRTDLEWAHKGRKMSEATSNRIWSTFIGLGAAGFAIGLWETFKSLMAKH